MFTVARFLEDMKRATAEGRGAVGDAQARAISEPGPVLWHHASE